MYEEVK